MHPQDTATFATTGGVVWKAAHRLIDYLEATADTTGLSRQGVKVLELGSGTGWMGMVLAQNLRGAEAVCMTEMEAGGALTWLKRNVDKNGAELWPEGRLTVEACDWSLYLHDEDEDDDDEDDDAAAAAAAAAAAGERGERVSGDGDGDAGGDAVTATAPDDTPTPTPSTSQPTSPPSPSLIDTVGWNFIVGSDLVYNEVGVFMPPRVIRSLLQRRGGGAGEHPLPLARADTSYAPSLDTVSSRLSSPMYEPRV